MDNEHFLSTESYTYLVCKFSQPNAAYKFHTSAMVTSTSTPGSMLTDVICFTTSAGLCKSMSRLWILISKRSQVLEPSPQGVLRVVMGRVLVGNRTGPLTISFFSFAPRISSVHTFSKLFTLRLVKVMRIRCTVASSSCTCFSL